MDDHGFARAAVRPAGAPSIREAGPADAPAIWALLQELAVYERLEHAVTGSASGLAAFLAGGREPKVTGYLAEAGGAPVGYALCFRTFSSFRAAPVLWLEDLYVQPAMRGRGLGRALLRTVARKAVEAGCLRVEWAVLDWNAPAIGFYESLGAVVAPDWRTCRLGGEALGSFVAEPGGRIA